MTQQRCSVEIRSDRFYINGRPTCEGLTWRGMDIEGLLMNSRMVQATFDDLNSETRSLWDPPEKPFDADSNTDAFIAMMPKYRQCGLRGFTLNLQGGNPRGYSRSQPWKNSAFDAGGQLLPDYMERLKRILVKADELNMVPILGLFYFGQDQVLKDEAAVIKAVENITDWLIDGNWRNVIIEIANECDHPQYDQEIIGLKRCTELLHLVKQRSKDKLGTPAGRLLVSTSLTGGKLPSGDIAANSDYLILHGNGVEDPQQIIAMVDQCRAMPEYCGQPILFNEDDHFDFDMPMNNMVAAVSARAGWGYFDYRMADEGPEQGYQSLPVDWDISSERKKGFFKLLAEMTQEAK